MRIETNSGKTLDADWLLDTTTRNGVQQLVIQLPGETPTADIFALIGADTIEAVKENGVKTVYEGYTLFSSFICASDRSTVRLTLEKGAADHD